MLNQLLSNRVIKTPSTEVSTDRYEFLTLSEAEPDLGVPSSNGYILASTATGTRSWLNPATALLAPGTTTQVIFNNAGVLSAASGLVYDNTTGNVGIGTTTPGHLLQIVGISTNTVDVATTGGDTALAGYRFRGLSTNADWTWGTNASNIGGAAATAFLLNNTLSTIPLVITSAGNMGIGTTTPSAKLDVAGNTTLRNSTTATNLTVHNTYTDASNYERAKIGWNTNVLEIGSEAAGTGTLRNISLIGGNVGIGTSTPLAVLDIASNAGRLRITQNVNASVFNGIDFVGHSGGVNGGLIWNQNTGEVRLNTVASYFTTFYSNGVEAMRINTSGNAGIGTDAPSAKLDVAGDIEVNSNVNLNSEATTLATVTKTQVASFPVASFRSGKLVVQSYDSVTGEVQISELLVAHNGTTASATEYGVVYTGASSLVLYDVDISAGNVRLMATRTTANSTQYKISETLMVA